MAWVIIESSLMKHDVGVRKMAKTKKDV